MPLDLTDDKSTLVQVMAWCRQATSHYLSQCWPRSMSPYGITRPQWVNSLRPTDIYIYIYISKRLCFGPLLKQMWLNQAKDSLRQWINGWNMLSTQVHINQVGLNCMTWQWAIQHTTDRPGELHMYPIPWSSLTQLMACCLFSADSLPDAMQTYCQIESHEHNYNAVKFESNSIWKCCLQNVGYNTAISMCWKVILAKSFVILIHLLTHWGLVMPLGDIDLGQHWLR